MNSELTIIFLQVLIFAWIATTIKAKKTAELRLKSCCHETHRRRIARTVIRSCRVD